MNCAPHITIRTRANFHFCTVRMSDLTSNKTVKKKPFRKLPYGKREALEVSQFRFPRNDKFIFDKNERTSTSIDQNSVLTALTAREPSEKNPLLQFSDCELHFVGFVPSSFKMHIHLPLFRLFLSVLLNMCPSSSGHILFSESTLQLLLVVNRVN